MTTWLISTIFQGISAAQAIAANNLVKQCPSAVPEAVCQPNLATMQQHIEKDAVSSARGEGKDFRQKSYAEVAQYKVQHTGKQHSFIVFILKA